jgi:type II secretory pathway pseudopilin PulG
MDTSHRAQRGFTYIGLLVAVVVMGLMLTMVAQVWTTTEQREREKQLLFVGHAYRAAIASYYAYGHKFPSSLDELLQDERFPLPKRHLRRLYADPITGQTDWNLVLTSDGQGIMGVVSSSKVAPIKRAGFPLEDEAFKDADCYCGWQFVYYANRFNRPTTQTSTGTLAPGSTTILAPRTLGTFSPGHLTSLPSNTGVPTLAPRSPMSDSDAVRNDPGSADPDSSSTN